MNSRKPERHDNDVSCGILSVILDCGRGKGGGR